jgi:uracil-DNA glycosylase family 4
VKTRREEILEELELGPAWLLRRPDAPAASTAPSEPGAPPVAVAARALVTERAAPPANAAPLARPEPAGAAIAEAQAPSISTPENRSTLILRMDWPQIKEAVAGCIACPLHKGRTKTVFGVGDERAEWMFVGEGPGADEDLKGEPFVGQAGKLLDNMLAAIKLKRGQNVYVANVVKCRPPGNRNPEPAEAVACEPYLQRQIALIRPKLIVALGKVAAVNLLKRDVSVASMRGKVHDYHGTPLIVTYHPAYLLRSLPEKAKAWVDLCFAVDTMKRLQEQALAR